MLLDSVLIDSGLLDSSLVSASPVVTLTFKQAFYAYLNSNLTGVSIDPLHVAEEATYPSLTFQVSERSPINVLGGVSTSTYTASIEIEVESKNYGEVDGIVSQLYSMLNNFSGQMSNVRVLWCFVDSDSDEYDTADDASDDGSFNQSVSISCCYFK